MTTANTKRTTSKSSNELYNTPKDALIAAYEAGIFDEFQTFYDPCNGLGDISNFLRSKGKHVSTGDIVDYGDQFETKDFLDAEELSDYWECIIFNPPFKLTEEFIDHALSLCPNLIMFNRATVLEAHSRSKKHSNKEWPLKKFYSFANRVSCTEGINREKTANSVWYGWFIYQKSHCGMPGIDWLFLPEKTNSVNLAKEKIKK